LKGFINENEDEVLKLKFGEDKLVNKQELVQYLNVHYSSTMADELNIDYSKDFMIVKGFERDRLNFINKITKFV